VGDQLHQPRVGPATSKGTSMATMRRPATKPSAHPGVKKGRVHGGDVERKLAVIKHHRELRVHEVLDEVVREKLHREAIDEDGRPSEDRQKIAFATGAQRMHQRERAQSDHHDFQRQVNDRARPRRVDRHRRRIEPDARVARGFDHGASNREHVDHVASPRA
jgi:hypothetical protein